MKTKITTLPLLLVLLFILEAFSVTNYKIQFFPPIVGPFLFMISGILIAVLPFLVKQKARNTPSISLKAGYSVAKILFLLIFFSITLYSVFECINNFKNHPTDYHEADMIPQIKVCCERLLTGEKVYSPMPEIWDGMKPTYLPAMWLPYIPLEYFKADVRWTGIALLLIFFGLYFFLLPNNRQGLPYLILTLFCCSFLFWFTLWKDNMFFVWTEEGVVMGYYLFLGFALIKKNPWLIGIAISLCFLSRYSLIFWAPMYIVFVFLFESRKNAIIISLVSCLIVLLMFVLPFLMEEPSYFLDIPFHSYRRLAIIRWEKILTEFDLSVSFVRFFDKSQVNMLHRIVMASTFVVPLLSLSTFIIMKKKWIQQKDFFGLCSLKLTMVFFYIFLEIPFFYLFFVPVFFSLPILFLSMREENSPVINNFDSVKTN